MAPGLSHTHSPDRCHLHSNAQAKGGTFIRSSWSTMSQVSLFSKVSTSILAAFMHPSQSGPLMATSQVGLSAVLAESALTARAIGCQSSIVPNLDLESQSAGERPRLQCQTSADSRIHSISGSAGILGPKWHRAFSGNIFIA